MSVNQNPPALQRPCLSGPPLSRDTDHFLSSHTSSFQSRGRCSHSSRAPGLHQVTSWGPCGPAQLRWSRDHALPRSRGGCSRGGLSGTRFSGDCGTRSVLSLAEQGDGPVLTPPTCLFRMGIPGHTDALLTSLPPLRLQVSPSQAARAPQGAPGVQQPGLLSSEQLAPPFPLSPAHSAPRALSLPGVAPCLGAPRFQKHSCTHCCLGRLSTEPFVLAGSLQQVHWETGLARGVVFRELGQPHGSRLSPERRELASLGLDSR